MAFNPDEYLASKQTGFNPDAYLAQKQPQATAGSEMEQAGSLTRNLVGFAAPTVKTYYGLKELLAGLSPEDKANLAAWTQMEEKAPLVSTLAGNIAPMAVGGAGLARAGVKGATALYAPKTAAQAATVGAGYLGIQPTGKDQLEGLGERAKMAALGSLLGYGGQKVAERLGTYFANKYGAKAVVPPQEIDDAINVTLKESGQNVADLPPSYINELRGQVQQAIAKGGKLDVKAALRAKEFESAGIQPTLGQVTRDPQQYAREMNLRGVQGVGDPLMERFTAQEAALRGKIGGFAEGAADRYQAGSQIAGALSKADEQMSRNVSKLYTQARQSAGKDLELPVQGLAQDYAQILRDFGDKVPSGVRNNLEDLGLISGKQLKMFTVEEADRLLKVVNANSSSDPAVNAALGRIRDAIKKTVLEVDASGGVYAPAVKAAAQRFKMHEMLPALQSAAKGELDADKFVSKHIIGAKPEAVSSLTKLLQSTDQEAFGQAKAQVGEYLRRAAYGLQDPETAAFRPAGYAKSLDALGERLKAFYTPEEIAQLKQLGRVGSYMNTFPAKAAVSTSNSGVPVQNTLLQILGAKIPGLPQGVEMIKGATRSAQQKAGVQSALSAQPPVMPLGLAPGQEEMYQNALRSLLAPVGYAGGYQMQ